MSSEARCWYLNQKGKATGPFVFSDLKSMAAQGTLKGHDLVFREGSHEWKRAYDWPELVSECFSDENRSSLSRLIRLPEEERAVEDQWVLLVREDGEKEVRFRQRGPYLADEIKRMLVEDKIKPSDHVWKKGAARWVPLYDVAEFKIHNLKISRAADAALQKVESMPSMAQAPNPFDAIIAAAPTPASVSAPTLEKSDAAAIKSKPIVAESVLTRPLDTTSSAPAKSDTNRQSVREWALDLVKESSPTSSEVGKAQVYSPEITNNDFSEAVEDMVTDPSIRIEPVDSAVANPSPPPQSQSPQNLSTSSPAALTAASSPKIEPMPESAVDVAPEMRPEVLPEPAAQEILRETAALTVPMAEQEMTVLTTSYPVADDGPITTSVSAPPVSERRPATDVERMPVLNVTLATEEKPAPPQATVSVKVASVAPTTPATVPAKVPAAVPAAAKKAAVAKTAAQAPAQPPADELYDFEPPKTMFNKMAPVFMVMLVGLFGAGIWATINTDRSVFQTRDSASTSSLGRMETAKDEVQGAENLTPSSGNATAPNNTTQNAVKPSASRDASENPTGPSVQEARVPTPSASAEKPDDKPAATVAPPASPAADFDGRNPIVRVNERNYLEILGPFRKGDLLRIRIEGRAGQILDLFALVQKYEIRAGQDNYYRISMAEARIPKGEYLVSVQYGMNRFSRNLGFGKDSQFSALIQNHRKTISYEQQQERKRLIKATKDFAGLLSKAESKPKDAAALKGIQKELDKKTPRELRLVKTNRYELIFFDYWERLAAQWERIQVTLKDNPVRNPASAGEFTKARKMATMLESEMRTNSIWKTAE